VNDVSTSLPTICTSTAYHPYTQVEANKYMGVEQTKLAQKLLWVKGGGHTQSLQTMRQASH